MRESASTSSIPETFSMERLEAEPDSEAVQKDVGIEEDGYTTDSQPAQTVASLSNATCALTSGRGQDILMEEGVAARMIIDRLELVNFKSYAGKKVIGPFHKRFSSVVGPNGSGKSNVIDALLFVFGKRASQVRLKKISELIHNSEHHQNLQEATVSVYFVDILDTMDDQHHQVVPGSDLVVSRTAFKNNTSKYSINGKLSNFTEVTQLLMAKGIDLEHNRFLILQGEVEQIAMMKPKGSNANETGVLEYLEDIIGSNKCIANIEATLAKVEELQQETHSKLTRVKVSERERDCLEEAKNEAHAYIREETRLLCSKSKLYQFFVRQSKKNVESVKQAMDRLNEKLADQVDAHTRTEKELSDLKAKYEEAKHECSGYEAEFRRFQDEYNKLDCRDVQLRAASGHAEAALKKIKTKVKKAKKKIEISKQAVEENTAAIPRVSKEVEKETKRLESEEKQRKSMFELVSSKTELLRKEMESKQKLLQPLQHSVVECEQNLNSIVSQIEIHVKAAESVQRSLDDKADKIKCIDVKIQSEEEQINVLKHQIAANKKKENDVKDELTNINGKLVHRRSELSQFTSEYDQGTSQLNQNQNRSSVLSALSVAKASGHITGIHGRLGDLGSIPSKFDIAVSTACPSLNHIVVDKIETAQKCADYLRQKQAGSSTFLILDKIRYLESQMNRHFSAPSESTRLFDLIEIPNSMFRIAFYFALRDTLVTETLESATKIGLESGKRQRVVSLTGDLIDPSGTMSGGGRNVSRGGMASMVLQATETSATRLQELEGLISNLHSELSRLMQSKKSLELELDALSSEIHNSEISLKRSENAHQALLQIKNEAKDAILSCTVSLKNKGNEAEKVKQSLRPAHEEAESSMVKARSKAAVIESQVRDLEQQIFETGGQELQEQIKLVHSIKDNIEVLKNQITHHQVNKDLSLKAIEDTEALIEKFKSEFIQGEQDLTRIDSEIQELENLAAKIIISRDEAAEVVEAQKIQLNELKDQCKKISKSYEMARQVEHDIRMQLEDCQRKFEENGKKADAWSQKLSEIAAKGQSNDESCSILDESGHFELAILTEKELEDFDSDQTEREIEALQRNLDRMKPNLKAIEDYSSADRNYKGHLAEYEAFNSSLTQAHADLEQLRIERHNQFMSGFKVITMKLKEMYQMLTLGGDAELELVDSLDPFSEGIVFSVRPPKKSWKNISNLSGGEKTLSSLALVFALHHFKPTPLYVMDEIDAALDFKNVSIVANYVRDRARNGQFIIISLRNNMFELANRLVGVYKNDNVSKTITIDPKLL